MAENSSCTQCLTDLKDVLILQDTELAKTLLTADCLKFLAALHRVHNPLRKQLLQERVKKAILYSQGLAPNYPEETYAVRQGAWQVNPVPKQLEKRWIEITGPPSKKGCINAMNSGADCWMADFEDSLAPSWLNLLQGQANLIEVNKKTLSFKEGPKEYKLNEKIATLIVRTRGWHLDEKNLIIDGEPISGAIFDFAVYFFHNYKIRADNGLGGVFYYLPKMESYKEAALWNDVFLTAQEYFKVPVGTIRCTVLIETIGGALDMDEILFSLKDHIVGLNAGRWDYIFSIIKKFNSDRSAVLPDRDQVTMTTPFMRAYTNRMIQTCHKRGAHAIGGMAAFIPSRTDKAINEVAFKKIVDDKTRELGDGCDGSWVAHPDLVKIARDVFEKGLKGKDHQKHIMREDVNVTARDLTTFIIPGGKISEKGVKTNIDVCIQYIYYWILGAGAVGLNNLMEDAATAEISRAQVWQWMKLGCRTAEGSLITPTYYNFLKKSILSEIAEKLTNKAILARAVEITDRIILSDHFEEFLTIPAYDILNNTQRAKL